MMQMFSQAQIGLAIQYWMEKEPTGDKLTLGKHARILSDVYGVMIYERRDTVSADSLSEAQIEAIEAAVTQGEQ